MAADQQSTGLTGECGVDRLFAADLDVEEIEAVVEQIDAVMDGAGEAEDVTVAVRPFGPAVERPVQVIAAGPARPRGENDVVGGDAVQHEAADGAAEGQ